MTDHVLEILFETLKARKSGDPDTSYVAGLYAKGTGQIAKKMGEEAVELVIEAVRLEREAQSEDRKTAFKDEAADLLFHYLVLLAHHDIAPQDVFDVLRARLGVGGLEEKAARESNR